MIYYSYILAIYYTRGPWAAMPALIKIKETGQINKYFYRQKNIQNWCHFTGKCIACVNLFTFLAQKALFAPHLYTLQIT